MTAAEQVEVDLAEHGRDPHRDDDLVTAVEEHDIGVEGVQVLDDERVGGAHTTTFQHRGALAGGDDRTRGLEHRAPGAAPGASVRPVRTKPYGLLVRLSHRVHTAGSAADVWSLLGEPRRWPRFDVVLARVVGASGPVDKGSGW